MAKRTRATLALEQAGKPFDLLEYTYDPEAGSIGLHAAQALGLPASAVFKTLMVTAGDTPCVAIIPSDRELSLKSLAGAAGKKSAVMMKPADAERISGYHVGGISPLGQRKSLPCFIDASAAVQPFIVVNGGQRGLQIKIAPSHLIETLDAVAASLTAAP